MYASRAALSGTRALFVYFLGEDRFEEIGAQGLPLGISSQFVSDPPKLLELDKGDLLVLAPDGFFEWTNEEGEQFGVKRVEETIRKSKEKRPNELISTLMQRSLRFPAAQNNRMI
jgi:sigma-B regulation protein RsbU (phosphoserine phosphatase)